jgi:hypothetical protein
VSVGVPTVLELNHLGNVRSLQGVKRKLVVAQEIVDVVALAIELVSRQRNQVLNLVDIIGVVGILFGDQQARSLATRACSSERAYTAPA